MTDTSSTSSGVTAADNSTTASSTTNGSTTTSNDKTNENTKKNDKEKNKTLAEIKIMESIRDMPSYTITIPRLIRGIHTDTFFYCPVADDFYEKNYPELVKPIANTKFARYAGFRKNWFYIDEVQQEMGDEYYTTVSFNPLPTSLGEYVKLRQEAEKALIQAMNSEAQAQYVGSVAATTGAGGVGDGLASNINAGEAGTVGLTQMSGRDCSETYDISVRSRNNINGTAKHLIGNSSANYAVDTAHMSGKQALLDIYNRFRYSSYANNRTCPQRMWNKSGTIRGNCADAARIMMCMGQVHGLKIGIVHITNGNNGHYFNCIELGGKVYYIDCCFKSTGYAQARYGGGIVNNLTKNGGPWSNG